MLVPLELSTRSTDSLPQESEPKESLPCQRMRPAIQRDYPPPRASAFSSRRSARVRPPQSDALTNQAGARAERHERRTAHKAHTEEVGEGVDATSAGATSGRRAPLPTLDVGSQPRPYNRSSRFLYDRADDDKELDFTCVWSSVCDKPAAYSLLPSSLCSHLPAGIELATQRVMLMRMAQPALMPNPRYLDAPPPGMMQRCHRESVVQFINE
eukprot:scaffold130053_cov54-Phaeocystis_antarctica.AAC.8